MVETSSKILKNIKTVRNIYMLANPRSGSRFAANFLEKYPRENTCTLRVPLWKLKRSPYTQLVIDSNEIVELHCTLYFFNVVEPEERKLCMQMLEKDVTEPGHENRDRILGIMGGDGSMGTTLKMLRTVPAIEKSLIRKEIGLVTLPFGTGNDTA